MTHNDCNSPLTPYARKVQHGMAVANRRMMARASIFGYSLVLGEPDGGYREQDARSLMEELRGSVWWKAHFED